MSLLLVYNSFENHYNICDVAFARSAKSTVLPFGTTPKIKNFRTFLEIQSFALAGKPTDANFVYYYITQVLICQYIMRPKIKDKRSVTFVVIPRYFVGVFFPFA